VDDIYFSDLSLGLKVGIILSFLSFLLIALLGLYVTVVIG